MRFFFDRNTSIRIARMVRAYETLHIVRHHDEDARFERTTADVDWIAALAEEKPAWVIISGDGRILKNKVEKAALASADLAFFCLAKGWMSMQIHEQAWKFIKVWPEIVEHALHHKAKVFEVGAGRSLKVEPIG